MIDESNDRLELLLSVPGLSESNRGSSYIGCLVCGIGARLRFRISFNSKKYLTCLLIERKCNTCSRFAHRISKQKFGE
jgi:hypothetical protein